MAHCDRWLAHLDNRLAYERAMLEDQGGYAEPKRKSKAELPILNYSGTISYRNPYHEENITGEAVHLTKAQWADIGPDYKGTRVSSCGTHRVRTTMMAPGRRHQLVAVFLTDSKQHARPTGGQIEAKAREEQAEREEIMQARTRRLVQRAAQQQAQEPDCQAEAFEALEQQAEAGVQVVAVPQLFPTPPALADRMVQLAEIRPEHRVLEPSAGTGNLLRAIGPEPDKVAVEIDPRLVEVLARSGFSGLHIHQGNFLECNGDIGTFDRIVMNPPFTRGEDIKHIKHAAEHLRPGGVLVALCASGPRQWDELRPLATSWEDLPPWTFKEQGTGVRVSLLLIRR
jgi:protein-L-isoaspartate O-methyltransferase